MSTLNRASDRHFQAYYDDNSLLIQFMIVEFIHTVQLATKLKAIIKDLVDQPAATFLSELKMIFEQLLDHHPQQERSSHSRWTQGALTKFKGYCEQFSRNSSHQVQAHIDLHMSAHQALLHAMHGQELVNALIFNPYVPDSGSILDVLPFKRTFDLFQSRVNQLIRLFPLVIPPFWHNENVILCFLRFQTSLAQIYGLNFMIKRFKWPIDDLIEFISDRYRERGFEALLPTILKNYL